MNKTGKRKEYATSMSVSNSIPVDCKPLGLTTTMNHRMLSSMQYYRPMTQKNASQDPYRPGKLAQDMNKRKIRRDCANSLRVSNVSMNCKPLRLTTIITHRLPSSTQRYRTTTQENSLPKQVKQTWHAGPKHETRQRGGESTQTA